jgi:hypothetical protein
MGGNYGLPFRPGIVRCPLKQFISGGYGNSLQRASNVFEENLEANDASLLDYVNWLKETAVLRVIAAHSCSTHTGFRYTDFPYIVSDLEQAVGGDPWRWSMVGVPEFDDKFIYAPSLNSQLGEANLTLYRTMWENQALNGTGASIFIHGGCEANSPAGATHLSYDDIGYGRSQNAESVLFFLNGVAVLSRAKIFFDIPVRDVADAFALDITANIGDGWKAYFENTSQAAHLAISSIDSKMAYNWSILGDWTVRLYYIPTYEPVDLIPPLYTITTITTILPPITITKVTTIEPAVTPIVTITVTEVTTIEPPVR